MNRLGRNVEKVVEKKAWSVDAETDHKDLIKEPLRSFALNCVREPVDNAIWTCYMMAESAIQKVTR